MSSPYEKRSLLYLQRNRILSPRPQEADGDLLQKMKGKELHAHVRALLAQMEEDDKEEFFADARRSGFLIRRSGLMSVSPLLDIYSVTTAVINSNKLSIPI